MRRFQKWAFIVALVFGPACHGQVVAGADSPVTISGTVRDPSGAPAAGVLVTFHPGFYPSRPDYSEVKTDKNGRYAVILQHKKIAGGMEVWAGPISLTNCIMARDLERNLAAIQEFSGTPTNIDLNLQPGLTLSGFVKDTKGAPLSNVPVDLSFLSGHSTAKLRPQPIKTDAQGSFSIPALPQGREYYFFDGFTAPGYGWAYGHLEAKDARTNHYEFPTFVLKPADRKLAGQVLGPDGRPVAGAKVDFTGPGQPRGGAMGMPYSTVTDTLGYFVFDAVCEGPVTVSVKYENYSGNTPAQGGERNVVVRLGINLVNSPNLSPPLKIVGTVRDPSGAPAAGVTLSLFPVQARAIKGQTDSEGRYEFNWQARVPGDGEARVAGEGEYWLMARDLKRELATIHKVDEKTTNLDLTLQEGLTLSTRVKDRDGRAVTNAAATVTIWEGQRGFQVDPQPTTSDDQGRLRLASLPQGQRYSIRVEAPSSTFDMLQAEAENTKINFLELRPSVLGLTDTEVSGLVLGLDGQPAAAIELQIFATGTGAKRTTTDSNGHFVFHDVSRGLVNIVAGLPAANGTTQSYSGNAQVRGGDTNVVVRLQVNTNRPVFGVAVTTLGTVFDPSGAPAPGVLLSTLPSTGLINPVRTDASGNYKIQWRTRPGRSNASAKAEMLARDPEHNWAATAEMDASTTKLDLHLQPGLTLSGAVQDADGLPVTNAVVQLVPYPPDDARSALNRQQPTNANAQGLFSINALPQGVPYLVHVAAVGYGSNNIPLTASDTHTGLLQLPSIVLKLANRQLTGQVIGLDGKPCWGAQVTMSGEGQNVGTVGATDSNGHFVITQVCDGLVDVRAMLPASITRGSFSVGIVQAHAGDTDVVVKLGLQNGVPIVGPGGIGPAPTNRPPPAPSQQ